MQVGQIVYKVDDLDQTVAKMKRAGYQVEYGKAKNPYNALIYFSDGPYIELMARTGLPKIIKALMRTFGYAKFANRFECWDTASEGNISIALEVSAAELADIYQYLKKKKIKAYKMSARRVDIHGRKLSFTCLFTEYVDMPFFATEFTESPKPRNFIHPNGGKGLNDIEISIGAKEYALLMEILEKCDLKRDLDLKVTKGDFKIQYHVAGVES